MARTNSLSNFLTDVASAIKTKKSDSTPIVAEDFDVEILALPTGTDTSDATASASDIVLNKTAYVDGVKITGTVPECITADGFHGSAAQEVTIQGSPALKLIGDVYTNILFRPNSTCEVTVPDNVITPIIGLTANKIKQGEVILGITGTYQGTDTSDATAVAGDIVLNKTAYVNGSKITGTIPLYNNLQNPYVGDVSQTFSYDALNHRIESFYGISDAAFKNGAVNLRVADNIVANTVGLTANKIKNGETILGVTGTYTGSGSMKEYASEAAMNSDLANISEGEVVKVVSGGVTTFYVKETTMKKLVKEEDTISPEEYIIDLGLANNILGSQS